LGPSAIVKERRGTEAGKRAGYIQLFHSCKRHLEEKKLGQAGRREGSKAKKIRAWKIHERRDPALKMGLTGDPG
jgi:hypothetical protein